VDFKVHDDSGEALASFISHNYSRVMIR
jgi:hypothetical protein